MRVTKTPLGGMHRYLDCSWLHRVVARYPASAEPVIALGVAVYGLLTLLGSAAPYRNATFRVTFEIAPRWVWSAAFIVAGVAALIWVRMWTAMLLLFTLMLWAMNILVATVVYHHDVPMSSPVLILTLAFTLGAGLSSRGAQYAPPPPRRPTTYDDGTSDLPLV